jgi:hypothetical protein
MAAGREFSISYNGLAIPSTQSGLKLEVHGVHQIRKSSRDFDVSFDVVVYAPTSAITGANFRSACIEIETKFRAPLADLVIAQSTIGAGGDTGNLLELRSTRREALNAEAEVEKVGSQADSARSRLYRVTISGELPYQQSTALTISGGAGLRDVEVIVEFGASRRAQLTIAGEYTGQPGVSSVSASAQYAAQISALVTAAMNEVTATWPAVGKPFSERTSRDKTNDTMRFERVYKEIITSESLAGADDADVIDQRLTIERVVSEHSTDPDTGVLAPQELRVSYEADIDKTNKNLREKWESVLQPFVISRVRSITTAGTISLVSESLMLDPVDNMIRANMVFMGWTAQKFASLLVDTATDIETGQEIADIFPEEDSAKLPDLKPTKAYRFGSAKKIGQTITTTRTTLGDVRPPDLLKGTGIVTGRAVVTGGGARTVVCTRKSSGIVNKIRGVRGLADTQLVTDEILVEELRLIEEIK